MLSKKIEKALIDQIELEEQSSRIYMSMASWCDASGYPGAAAFLFTHSEEERMHMIKMLGYVNDKGGHAILHRLDEPENSFTSLQHVFEEILKHEELVTASINNIYGLTLEEKDYTTGQFLQWYIQEQVEEESLFRGILDKFRLAGDHKGGLFHIDKELASMATATQEPTAE